MEFSKTWGEVLADRLARRLKRIRVTAIPLTLLVYGYWRYKLGSGIADSIFVATIPLILLGVSYLHAWGVLNYGDRLETLKKIEKKQEAYSYVYGGVRSEIKLLLISLIVAILLVKFR